MEFMTRDRKQIDRQLFQVDGYFPHGLHAIYMQERARVFSYDAANLSDGKQNSSFIICHHHGNDSSARPQSLAQITEIDLTITIYFQPGYFATNVRQMLTKTTNCLVFDGRRNDVTLIRVLL